MIAPGHMHHQGKIGLSQAVAGLPSKGQAPLVRLGLGLFGLSTRDACKVVLLFFYRQARVGLDRRRESLGPKRYDPRTSDLGGLRVVA